MSDRTLGDASPRRQPPFTPSAPVQRRLQSPPAKSKFLAVKVVEAVTLATAKGSTYLALEDETRLALGAKFGIVELDNVLAPFQLATHSLTNSEGRYFLKFGSLTALKSRTASEAEKISLDIQEEVSAIEENRQQELLGFSSEELQQNPLSPPSAPVQMRLQRPRT
ncbi:hypothetical protein OAF21_09275, partial [Akkermansiaceae bacterium]|nr:hypothetical protein [Akkermansiaceae bacterium]